MDQFPIFPYLHLISSSVYRDSIPITAVFQLHVGIAGECRSDEGDTISTRKEVGDEIHRLAFQVMGVGNRVHDAYLAFPRLALVSSDSV